MNPLEIEANNLGKKFNSNVIFRDFNAFFPQGSKVAFTGDNGSGKSTLLLSIAGFIQSSHGKVTFKSNGKHVTEENKFIYYSFAAPYLELNETLSGIENVAFQMEFKASEFSSPSSLFSAICLEKAAQTPVKYYSSGMKQLLKLSMAISAKVPVLFLDEPCSNLDDKNTAIFLELMNSFAEEKTLLLGTNHHPVEMKLVNQTYDLLSYK